MDRQLFPFFENNEGVIYLDNANTTQILGSCLSSYIEYYNKMNYNIGRTSYKGAREALAAKEAASKEAASFLNAKHSENIIWTTGATEGLNLVAFSLCSLMRKHKTKKATILTSRLEHASTLMPWMVYGKGLVNIEYIEEVYDSYKVFDNHDIDINDIKKGIERYNPDIILLSSMTNTTGAIRPLKEIGQLVKEKGLIFIVDHAQGVAHMPIDVQECNIDFLAFSLHKMYGPKGVGVLYAKKPNVVRPMRFGGGMNKFYTDDGEYEFQEGEEKMHAGTENVPEIYASIEAFKYMKANYDKIKEYETYLGMTAYKLISRLPYVEIYSNPESPILLFKIDDGRTEALDIMNDLDKHDIYIRGGNHCVKLTSMLFGLSTCRISIGIYNTVEDLYKLYITLRDRMKDT